MGIILYDQTKKEPARLGGPEFVGSLIIKLSPIFQTGSA